VKVVNEPGGIKPGNVVKCKASGDMAVIGKMNISGRLLVNHLDGTTHNFVSNDHYEYVAENLSEYINQERMSEIFKKGSFVYHRIHGYAIISRDQNGSFMLSYFSGITSGTHSSLKTLVNFYESDIELVKGKRVISNK